MQCCVKWLCLRNSYSVKSCNWAFRNRGMLIQGFMSCSTPLNFVSYFFSWELCYMSGTVQHYLCQPPQYRFGHPKCFEQSYLSSEALLPVLWNELVGSKQPGIVNKLVACHQPSFVSILGLNSSLAKCGRNIQLPCLKLFTATVFSRELCWERDAINRAMILQTALL